MTRLVLIFFISIFNIYFNGELEAQEDINFKEGFIVYDVMPAGNSDYSEFFSETTLTLYIKNEKSKLDLKMFGGLAQLQLLDLKRSKSVALLNLPTISDKVSILMSNEQSLFNFHKTTIVNQSPYRTKSIEIFPKDKTRIAGKKAYKAIVPFKNNRQQAAFYLAKNLKFHNPEIIKKYFGDLPGIPLQAEFNFKGQRFIITAKEIRKTKINDRVFEIPEDYKNKSYEDLIGELENLNESNIEKGL